jgi:hypothetical protein
MPQENNIPSKNSDTSQFKVDVVPLHHTRRGGPLIDTARDFIHTRNEGFEAAAKLEADIAHLQKLREKPPRRNIFKRRRQRRALANWLEREGYGAPDAAHSQLSDRYTRIVENTEGISSRLEAVWLPQVRKVLDELHDDDKAYADSLFRAHGFPNDALEACDQQAAAAGQDPNVLVWLSQKPTANNLYGASDQELESILLWNATCTERMAANPEGVERMVNEYLAKINTKVAEGQLDASWTDATPAISRVIVGDIMNIRFLGYKGVSQRGSYSSSDQTLTLWPYELEDENNSSHVCDHECTHALGGFKEKWLDEGFAEIFTRIINNQDPFGESTVYEMNRQGIKKLLEGAGTTCKDASAFFIGHDAEANEARLGEFLAQAYGGNDVLTIITNAYRESFENNDVKLLNPEMGADAFFVATYTATFISDLFKDAQHDPRAVAEYTKHLALSTKSQLKYIALKHAHGLFAGMADEYS